MQLLLCSGDENVPSVNIINSNFENIISFFGSIFNFDYTMNGDISIINSTFYSCISYYNGKLYTFY